MGAECCKATGSVGSLNLYTDFAGDSDLKASISQATSLLRKAQTIKQTLQTCRDKSEKITTIPLRDPLTFIQNAQVLQWALSASHHGNIQQAGFSISAVSPFLDIKSIPLNSESYELLECLQIYIDTVTTQANTMKQIVEDLYGLKSELNKWKQSRESQNDKEGTKATSYKKLVQEMRAITNLEESLRETKAKLPWMIEKVQSLIITADEVGFQADREGISNMRDITARFRISLDSGQEKKKWVMRTSNAEGVVKPRDSNVQRIDKGKGVRESSQPIENRENAKQYQSVSFGANFSSLRSNSRNMDNISPFQSTKDCFVGEKARMPLASLKIAELDKNNPKLKESSVTFRVRASDLENNGKIIQLGSKHNPFTLGSTDISNANGSLNGVCDLKEKSHGKSGSCSLIKEKLSLLDMDKLASMLDENLIDDDNLSISIVQDSARKHISKAQW